MWHLEPSPRDRCGCRRRYRRLYGMASSAGSGNLRRCCSIDSKTFVPSRTGSPTSAAFDTLCRLFFCSRACEDADHGLIPFMAGKFVQPVVTLSQRNDDGPELRPGGRIVERDLVVDGFGRTPRETLDEMQVFGSAHEVALRREVRRLHNQRCPFPPPARITVPMANPFREMRPAVQRDDARLMDRFHHQHHISGRLDDLEVSEIDIPVATPKPWNAVGNAS